MSSGQGAHDITGPHARTEPHHKGGHSLRPSEGPYRQHRPKPAGQPSPDARVGGTSCRSPPPQAWSTKLSPCPLVPVPPAFSLASGMVSLSKPFSVVYTEFLLTRPHSA